MFVQRLTNILMILGKGNPTKSLSVSENFSWNWQIVSNSLPLVVQTQKGLSGKAMNEFGPIVFTAHLDPNRTHHSPCNLVSGSPHHFGIPQGIIEHGPNFITSPFFGYFFYGPTLFRPCLLGPSYVPVFFVTIFFSVNQFKIFFHFVWSYFFFLFLV